MSKRLTTPYGHRFPTEIISHAIWLYRVFSLSFRDVELLLAGQDVMVSYETIQRWCLRFDQDTADKPQRQRPKPGNTWQLDEVSYLLHGQPHRIITGGLRSDSIAHRDIIIRREAPAEPHPQQPGRELPPACPLTRVADAAVQVARPSAAFPISSWIIHGHFHPRSHLITAQCYRSPRSKAFRIWQQETGAQFTTQSPRSSPAGT